MDTCYLFTQYLNESGCFCLKLAADGSLLNEPQQLLFDEIQQLQHHAQTVLVEPCSQVSLISLSLSWLSDNKARVAIPYALEDKLAQPVDRLHFAFDKLRYHNNTYLITVIDKSRMHYLMKQMAHHQIAYDMITVDWFALEEGQLCVNGTSLLINQDHFKGSLTGSLALTYMIQHPEVAPLLFKNNQLITHPEKEASDELSYLWLARQLLKNKPLNLCQGEMQHGNALDWFKRGYLIAASLAAFWLISILLIQTLSLHSLNNKINDIDQQIAVIYHQFFPQAKQVISPKFRIEQVLGATEAKEQNQFWFLMNALAKTIKNSEIKVEQLKYQNKILSITLLSPDFGHLESLENALKQQVQVRQTEASTHEQQVIATLELS
ncbi:MAG: general secretion pathway protein GspL [Legionella sp.]|nr:MAG: general secretion pathway protein GspL [Legionella sp.]PJD98798.1 MAG: general secretion pathway protein GspL [Legionella sp.]